MADRFQVTLFDPADASVLAGADELFWTLDGLTPADNPTATIASLDTAGRFVEVTVREDAGLTIRYREHAADDIHAVDDADILAAHQAILTCLGSPHGWRRTLDPIGGTFGVTGSPIDYQQTGLSIANAMLDAVKRRQRLDLPRTIPPTIRWGSRDITTGDTWHGVPSTGRITVRVLHPDHAHEHGIAIRAPGGTVDGTPAETVNRTATDTAVDYVSPTQTLQVCNVYVIRGATWERVDRWSEQAGMVIEPAGALERVYHCNHMSTDPPSFADLTFSPRLTAG
ncbi:hypothetical protein AB0K00_18620 [Dactylosporangium sp. NPDC049525]|uniref:hypothetical protein n=1 Tax=Dactylosporangium sp. NPDC049525 TaxID=3154730 RepID=UPI003432DFC5